MPYDYDATGMKCYLAACDKVGVIPVSHFLRNLTEPIVSLRYHGLGSMGAYSLSRALIVSFSIEIFASIQRFCAERYFIPSEQEKFSAFEDSHNTKNT